jgi:exopolyphosphatase / guanosine-5'-triphosphate,3'-diphosphate pyrophosphatase
MVCACVDIGTNTTRVLVADVQDGRLIEVLQQRAFTRIGITPEIARDKISEVAEVVAEQVALAHDAGAAGVRVVATAAIRAALNRDEFLAGMTVEVEILDEDEEARMAFLGATQTLDMPLDGKVAVVDVGGGSTEIAVGAPPSPPAWLRSVDIGALRLTAARLEDDPPSDEALAAAARATHEAFVGTLPPRPHTALAVGGSARAIAKLVGRRLGERELDDALELLSARPAAKLARLHGIDVERARVLPAGALILAEVVRRLGVPLQLGRGGLREGVALSLLAEARAA